MSIGERLSRFVKNRKGNENLRNTRRSPSTSAETTSPRGSESNPYSSFPDFTRKVDEYLFPWAGEAYAFPGQEKHTPTVQPSIS